MMGKSGKTSRSAKAPQRQSDDKRPLIRLAAGELEKTVDATEAALISANRGVYQRSGMIVGVGSSVAITAGRKKIDTPQIMELGEHRLLELAMSAAAFEKFDARANDYVPCNAPMTVIKALQQRAGHYRLPPLAGIINAPTLRADGSLLTQPGYDSLTGLLFDPLGAQFPAVAERPTRSQAQAALSALDKNISTFPFVSEADRSVALSAILTACVRPSLRTAPMHVYTAPVAGSGKSKLVDVASVIATGTEAGVIAQGNSEEELEKRLTSLLLTGSAIAIDNVESALGGDCLCQLLTQPTIRGRVLGASRAPQMPTNVFVTATGNNIVLVGDMTRRALLCTLNPGVERPELRTFDFEPVEFAKAHRGKLVAAALTVLRAYHIADRPFQVAPLGSFEEWSGLVRSALVWLGAADPVATMERTRAYDPKIENLRSVMMQWRSVIGAEKVTASGAAQRAAEKSINTYEPGRGAFLHPDFRDALLAVSGAGGFIDPARLGTWLGRNKGRVIEGMHFEPESQTKGISAWSLHIDSANTYAAARQ